MGIYAVTTEGAETTNANPETLVAVLGATSVKAELVEFGVSFAGTTATDAPVLVELYQVTTSGTSTGATEAKVDRSGPTAQCAGYHSFTVEPTKGDRIGCWYVHPQGGNLVVQYPLGARPIISDASTSQGLAVVTTTALSSLTAVAYMTWAE